MMASKRDYYEVLGVAQDGGRRGDQEGVPQAGHAVPPRPQRRRRGGGEKFKEAAEAYEVLRDPREAAVLRPLRPRRPEGRAAGSLRRRRPRSRPVRRHVRRASSAAAAAAGGSARAAAAGADLQDVLEIDLVEAATGVEEVGHASARGATARRAAAPGRSRARSRPRAGAAGGQGVVRPAAGLLPHPADLPRLRRPRGDHHRPVPDLPRRRPRRRPRGRSKSTSRRASTPATASGCPGEGEAGDAGRAAGDLYSSSASASTRSSSATART